MTDRRIALVAVDACWRDPNGTFFSFSYGIEKLRASIVSAPDLQDVEILLLDLPSDDPEAFFEALRDFRPTLVGLSTFVWSLGVHDGLTARLRQHWGDGVVIVAGGPAARRSVFDLPTYRALRDRLDAVVTGEGEAVIRELVRHHVEPDWRTRVRGLDLPARGLWRSTGTTDRPELDAYPSPYQLDLAPLHKTGYIEMFRGCPIHCAFCQWGEQKSDRVHGVEYLKSHLEGLHRARVPNIFFLDAAFNLSPRAFRALAAAEAEVGVLADAVIHGHLYPTYLEEHHLAFFDGIKQVYANVGIQSFDEDVLERLGRPFDVTRFERMLARMRGRLRCDIELIFGLPGDNPDSFRRTVERSLALGDSVKVFWCLALPDALLERAGQMSIEYDPVTFRVLSCDGWTADALEREWAWLHGLAAASERPILKDDWIGFVINPDPEDRSGFVDPGELRLVLEDDAVRRLRTDIAGAAPQWDLDAVHGNAHRVCFDLQGPQGAVVLQVAPHRDGEKYFALRDGLAYSHRGSVDRATSGELRRIIDTVHADARALVSEATARST